MSPREEETRWCRYLSMPILIIINGTDGYLRQPVLKRLDNVSLFYLQLQI